MMNNNNKFPPKLLFVIVYCVIWRLLESGQTRIETHVIIPHIVYYHQTSLFFVSTMREIKENFASFAHDAKIQNKSTSSLKFRMTYNIRC